jgi:hypothetical protein
MIDIVWTGARLLFAGKLFKNNQAVMRLLLAGTAAGAAVLVVSSLLLPLWAASVIGGAATGLLQPYLFRDIKFAL